MEDINFWLAIAFSIAMNLATLKGLLDMNSRLEKLERERDAK